MSKPHIHAESSARRFRGKPEDYLEIHQWFDQTKAFIPDNRHRAILHSSFGIFLCSQVFGDTIINSDGIKVAVRDIGEQHVLEDFGGRFIPTPQDYLEGMEYKDWMSNGKTGTPSSHKKITEKEQFKKILEMPAPDKKEITYDGSFKDRLID